MNPILGGLIGFLLGAVSFTQGSPLPTPGQGLREQASQIIAKNCTLLDPAQAELYAVRVTQAVGPLRGAPPPESILRRVDYWTKVSLFELDPLDYYRRAAAEHPELQVLALPDTYYFQAHEHGIRILELELAGARKTPPISPAAAEELQNQIAALKATVKESLLEKVQGAYAERLVDSLLAQRAQYLRGEIGSPFSGINRTLTQAEIAEIKEAFLKSASCLPVLMVDREELADPLAASKIELNADREHQAILDRAAEIHACLTEHLNTFSLVLRLTNPGVSQELKKLEATVAEAKEWMKAAKAGYGERFLKAVTLDRVKAAEQLRAATLSGRSNDLSSPSATAPVADGSAANPVLAKKAGSGASPWDPRVVWGGILILGILGAALYQFQISRRAKRGKI